MNMLTSLTFNKMCKFLFKLKVECAEHYMLLFSSLWIYYFEFRHYSLYIWSHLFSLSCQKIYITEPLRMRAFKIHKYHRIFSVAIDQPSLTINGQRTTPWSVLYI